MAVPEGAALSGRKFRQKQTDLNYMYASLGMEQDDSNDDDFLPADTEESADEEEASSRSDQPISPDPKKRKQKRKQKRNAVEFSDNKKAKSGRKKRQHSLIQVSPHAPTPSVTPKKNRKVAEDAAQTGGDNNQEPENNNEPDEVDSADSPFRPEYKPRKRTSKHLEEMDSIHDDGDKISNVVSPFPSCPISTWEEFDKVFEEYKQENNLKFRVRSLENDDQLPTEFRWSHKVFRCTHGVSQGSRSKGHRNRRTRYCECKARFTATVIPAADNDHEIGIRNENHTHSHPTTATQASSYLTTETLPLDEEDREDVKTLADARVSSKHISNFLNERTGM
ncbi:hypothetical protein V7S43_017409 [Phytophthora oleae]|uniref:FAR1 domain-containing protein n=1 Tax=Phytophthora oleae TaxID=2107226 RepID=A0ABD3EU80_9STRA